MYANGYLKMLRKGSLGLVMLTLTTLHVVTQERLSHDSVCMNKTKFRHRLHTTTVKKSIFKRMTLKHTLSGAFKPISRFFRHFLEVMSSIPYNMMSEDEWIGSFAEQINLLFFYKLNK